MTKLLIAALMLGLEMAPPVAIRMTPRVLMSGGNIRVTCTVPRRPENRGVTAKLPNYRSMYDQLNGENARVTHEFLFERVPCGVTEAICVLESQGNPPQSASLAIEISGCEP